MAGREHPLIWQSDTVCVDNDDDVQLTDSVGACVPVPLEATDDAQAAISCSDHEAMTKELQSAIEMSCWDRVVELMKRNTDPELRDFVLKKAVEKNQSCVVPDLVEMGLGPGMVNLPRRIREAISYGHWECVRQLVAVGVSEALKRDVLVEAVKRREWDVVMALFKDTANSELTDYVLREAVTDNQWDFVSRLVNRSSLISKDQLLYVCKMAVKRNLWQHAYHALERGAHLTFDIVDYAFKNDKGGDIFRLFMDGLVVVHAKGLILRAAVKYKQWDMFGEMLDSQNFTDQELGEAVNLIIINSAHAYLKELLTRSARGMRVFKQLCLTKLPVSPDKVFHMFSYLSLELNKDLAVYVCCTQGLWDTMLQHYEDKDVSARSRRFALKQAIKQHAWVYVTKMAGKSVTPCRDRRLAILESVKQGQWEAAMKLCEQVGFNISNSDIRYILKVCYSLKMFHVVIQLCQRFSVAGKVKAIPSIAYIALKCAVQAKNWEFARHVIQIGKLGFSEERFAWLLKNIRRSPEAWGVCAPVLSGWCGDLDFNFYEMRYYLPRTGNSFRCRALAKWCLSHALYDLALLLALVSEYWPLAGKLVKKSGERISKHHLIKGFEVAFRHSEIDTAVLFLQHMRPDDVDFDFLYDFCAMDALLNKCRIKRVHVWTVELAIMTESWDVVADEMEGCQDQGMFDRVGVAAASENEWDLVSTILGNCSQSALKEILRSAVRTGELECANVAIAMVDPRFKNNGFGPDSILYYAVESWDNREEMVRLCIKSGVSTHHRSVENAFYSPMRCALHNGQLPLVRLLHESGSCSNRELYQLKNDASIRAQLERQNRQDIVRYVDQAASNPGSLQHLARLAVSHLIGCWPGRQLRVQSLPLPQCHRDFVMFEDVLS